MSIGEKIAQVRKQQGMTQAKLAELTELSTSAIAMYETNRRQPDEQTLNKIKNALGVSSLHDASKNQSEKIETAQQQSTPNKNLLSSHPVALTETAHMKPNATMKEVSKGMAEIALTDEPLTQEMVTDIAGLTSFALTREEARMILFIRMNPSSMHFLQTYITADQRKRDQLEKTWKLVREFQA